MLVRSIHLAVPTLLLLSGAISAMAQRAQVVGQTPIPAQSTLRDRTIGAATASG